MAFSILKNGIDRGLYAVTCFLKTEQNRTPTKKPKEMLDSNCCSSSNCNTLQILLKYI